MQCHYSRCFPIWVDLWPNYATAVSRAPALDQLLQSDPKYLLVLIHRQRKRYIRFKKPPPVLRFGACRPFYQVEKPFKLTTPGHCHLLDKTLTTLNSFLSSEMSLLLLYFLSFPFKSVLLLCHLSYIHMYGLRLLSLFDYATFCLNLPLLTPPS